MRVGGGGFAGRDENLMVVFDKEAKTLVFSLN